MNRQQAINYLLSSGFSEEQINTIEQAFKQEPTNDLGVDCISREATVKRLCNLAEYMNEHKENSGDPYIMAALFIQDNKTEFPSVTPQEPIEPMVEIDLYSVIRQKYIEREVLDKIRIEIEKAVWEDVVVSLDGTDEVRIPRLDPDDVFEIIDKYKAESEKA